MGDEVERRKKFIETNALLAHEPGHLSRTPKGPDR